jgi:hypothetical protein
LHLFTGYKILLASQQIAIDNFLGTASVLYLKMVISYVVTKKAIFKKRQRLGYSIFDQYL